MTGTGRARDKSDLIWLIRVGLLLLASSLVIYVAHFLIFGDPRTVAFFLLSDIAFLPADLLLVGLVLERLLTRREKRALHHKLNMLIGVFFSRLGTDLMRDITACGGEMEEVKRRLGVRLDWAAAEFAEARRYAKQLDCVVALSDLDLNDLRTRLVGEQDFLVRLLENPSVLDHEQFTDLLWSLFHLSEELQSRTELRELSPSAAAHLTKAVKRVYRSLLITWVAYTQHLKSDYPYLFNLVCRIHPLQDKPSPVVV